MMHRSRRRISTKKERYSRAILGLPFLIGGGLVMPNIEAIRSLRISEAGNCKPDGGVPLVASVRQITDLEVAREYINYIDCSMIKEKLMQGKEEGGPGWNAETANKAEVKYKMWLFLKLKYQDEILPPSREIDLFWHAHILDSHAYFRDTQALFGKYLHHYPYFGMRGKADEARLATAFEETKRLFHAEYGSSLTE
jgi:hypothetical protein